MSKKAIISSSHKQELLGQDSPGVGFYEETDLSKVYKEKRDQTNRSDMQFGTVPRFFEFKN